MKMVIIRTTATDRDGYRVTYEEAIPYGELKKMGYPENEIRPWKGTLEETLDMDGEDHFIHSYMNTLIDADDHPSILDSVAYDNEYYTKKVDVKIVDETPKYIPLNKGK
jgi:hypothetical protein